MVHHRILSYQFLHKLCNKKFASLERCVGETFHLANDIFKNKIILLDLIQLSLSLHNLNKVTLS